LQRLSGVGIDIFRNDFHKEVKLNVPKTMLPEGAQEGSWLKLSLELDPEGTEKQKKEIEDKLKKRLEPL